MPVFKPLLVSSVTALLLTGCFLYEPEPEADSYLLSMRRLNDSVLVYSVSGDRVPFNDPAKIKGRLRVFQVRYANGNFSENRLLAELDSVVPCGDMRLVDSVVALSFSPFGTPGAKVRCTEGGEHADRLFVGRLGLEPFSPLPSPADTAALKIALRQDDNSVFITYDQIPGIKERGGLYSPRALCLEAAPYTCLHALAETDPGTRD